MILIETRLSTRAKLLSEHPSIVALRSRRRAGRGGHPNFSGFGLSRLSAARSFVSRGAQISRMHALRRLPFESSRLADVDALTEDPETVETLHGPESQSSDGAVKKKTAKSAISVVSYPELPLPGYGLTLIPNCNCGMRKRTWNFYLY
jgi:hypothetical protein